MLLDLSPLAAHFCEHPVSARQSISTRVTWKTSAQDIERITLASAHLPLLMRSKSMLVARTQDNMCVKMRTPPDAIRHELERYLDMPHDVKFYYVPFLCVFEVKLGDKLWAGICMPFIPITMCHILPTRKLALDNIAAQYDGHIGSQPHGLPLVHPLEHCTSLTASDLEIRLIRTCFRLLHNVHKHAWVHGDTHLGNFVFDPTTWHVYLIDAERSFFSTDPVQYFLDAQELFAHCTHMMVSLQDSVSWDLTDITGVAAKMHPCLTDQGTPLNNFMPVCSCFVQQHIDKRQRGCSMCRSPLNVAQANAYITRALPWLRKTEYLDYKALKDQIEACREDIQKEVDHLTTRLMPSIILLQRFVQKLHQDKPQRRVLQQMCRLLHTFYEDPRSISLWFKYALYRGAFAPEGCPQATAFLKLLTLSSLHALAAEFKEAIVPSSSFRSI